MEERSEEELLECRWIQVGKYKRKEEKRKRIKKNMNFGEKFKNVFILIPLG